MQRSAWIFLSAILLPSLGLAWLAIHSVRDQQVVVQHQQAIICQNLTDTLAKNIQDQMDHVRQDFVRTTGQLLAASSSPEDLAANFNLRLHPVWPLAEIGFAVDLDGKIYSPQVRDGLPAQKFRDENDRFLSNRENAEVYFSNGLNSLNTQAASSNNYSIANAPPAQLQQSQWAPAGGSTQAGAAPADLLEQNQSGSRLANILSVPTMPPAAPPTISAGLPTNLDAGDQRLQDKTASSSSSKTLAVNPSSAAPASTTPDNVSNAVPVAAPVAPPDQTTAPSKEADAQKNRQIQAATAADRSLAMKSKDKAQITNQQTATAQAETDQLKAPHSSAAPLSQDADAVTSAAPPGQAATSSPTLDDTTRRAADAPEGRGLPPADSSVLEKAINSAPTSPVSTAPQSSNATLAPPPAPTEGEVQTNPITTGAAGAETLAPEATAAPQARSSLNIFNSNNSPLQQAAKLQRKVFPQQLLAQNDTPTLSNTVPSESDFRQVIGSETSGSLARFLENKLCLMVWSHTPVDSPIVFGAQLDQARLIETLKTAFQAPGIGPTSLSDALGPTYCFAILDDNGHPVATSLGGFTADWKHPFVATELGEALPHWEAALYLIDPHQIDRTARTLQLTLGLIVLLLVAAIVAGGSLIAGDIRRQVRLAQQKTDFVSNVSHELKTPLTSIRMFADLLAEKRVPDEQKQSTYLRIIAAEAARLTRLINNVLDFARLERGAPPGEPHACDLVDAVRDVIETCQPHLETTGIAFHSEIETEKLPLMGDRDALAQIILNLVSNAEKYGGNDITVRVRRQETPAGVLGCVDVMDRGAGISPKDMKTIFEPFHRLDDSLASGIPGSGLGLTLARRMARAHGGDVTCSARAGGGTCFTLSVPLTRSKF